MNLLRKIGVEVANGKKATQAAREVGICEQTYYRWRKEFGGLKLDSEVQHFGGFAGFAARQKKLIRFQAAVNELPTVGGFRYELSQ